MEHESSIAAGTQPDAVKETLERLEVANTLEELRHHIDDLIDQLSEKERAAASGGEEFSPELEGQIEDLGDKVESASNLLAELTDLLEAQTERIETIEQQLGDPDLGDYRTGERAATAQRRDIPRFSMRPPREEAPPVPELRGQADPTTVLREYLDARLECLETGLHEIEQRISDIRGAAEERDRQVRELEERLLILVDSGVPREPALERASAPSGADDSPRREPALERASAPSRANDSSLRERVTTDNAPLDDAGAGWRDAGAQAHATVASVAPLAAASAPRPEHMPLFAHGSSALAAAKARDRGVRFRDHGGFPLDGPPLAARAPFRIEAPGSGGVQNQTLLPLRVSMPIAAGRPDAMPAVPFFVTEIVEMTRGEPPLLLTKRERQAAFIDGAVHAQARGEAILGAARQPAAAERAAPVATPRAESMREIEKLVEKDVRSSRDFGIAPANGVRPKRAHPIVLVVDDAPDTVKLISIYLSKTGYQVVTASSAEDCLAKLRHHHVDALVLDAKLPGASGAHVCRVLREDPAYAARRHVPVIVYTGYPDEFPAEVRAEWRAAEYVVKSGDLLPLITALVRHTTAGARP